MSAPGRDHGGGLVQLFVRHPNAANLLMILMLIAGAFALARINTTFVPTVEEKQITGTVTWSGASAEDGAANILDAVEPAVLIVRLDGEELARIPLPDEPDGRIHARSFSSGSLEGALVSIELELEGRAAVVAIDGGFLD